MIKITATLDGKADLPKFVHNLRVNLQRSQSRLAHRVTNYAYTLAKQYAPVWKSDLRNKIAMKLMPKKGEVFIAGSWLDQIKAKANEFGTKPHLVDRDEFPMMDEWAADKGLNATKILVGGPNTRLGKTNKFFEPAFIQVQRNIPMIMAEVIRTALMKTRA